jgi:hypothetical protein
MGRAVFSFFLLFIVCGLYGCSENKIFEDASLGEHGGFVIDDSTGKIGTAESQRSNSPTINEEALLPQTLSEVEAESILFRFKEFAKLDHDLFSKESDEIIAAFTYIEHWVNEVITLDGRYDPISDEVKEMIIAKLGNYYTEEQSEKYFNQFYKNENNTYTFLAQEAIGYLNLLQHIEVSIKKESDEIIVELTGTYGRSEQLHSITERYRLEPFKNKYLISDVEITEDEM